MFSRRLEGSKRIASAQIAARVRSALRDAAWEEGRSSGRTGVKWPRGMSSDSTGTVRSVRIHKDRATFPTNLTGTPSISVSVFRRVSNDTIKKCTSKRAYQPFFKTEDGSSIKSCIRESHVNTLK